MYLLQDKRVWITLTKYMNDHSWLNVSIQFGDNGLRKHVNQWVLTTHNSLSQGLTLIDNVKLTRRLEN